MHFNAVLVGLAALVSLSFAQDQANCYTIENWGSKIHDCGQCDEGYKFSYTQSFCDIGFQCCKGTMQLGCYFGDGLCLALGESISRMGVEENWRVLK
ncbi:uncharacterized protein G6M90_00g090360 [Metarhizium brunneum]|uniref:Uncharacterized protein n=1 Tax=Metarhizium brunneum TaxID=500148 RepID=A0A7D5V1H9_9HYPO|nr:hypothetical protein G6M90_00g090360 [Metarhizium brunneum]